MTTAISHRGPDGDGYFSDDVSGSIGHRRLAIIDLATAGSAHRERRRLPSGSSSTARSTTTRGFARYFSSRWATFRTHSDTETILHAYEEYGRACLDRLEGMFSFAIYDRARREVFLRGGDRLGKKPLFYAVLGGVLHFGSEMKSFYRSPLWSGELDVTGLEGYLSLGYFLAPATVYRDVRKLEPGHCLRVRNGRLSTRRYWDVEEFDSDRRPEPEVLADLERLIRDAVRERLMSEVPLGAFLSGGIDSGLVVSFMAEVGASGLLRHLLDSATPSTMNSMLRA